MPCPPALTNSEPSKTRNPCAWAAPALITPHLSAIEDNRTCSIHLSHVSFAKVGHLCTTHDPWSAAFSLTSTSRVWDAPTSHDRHLRWHWLRGVWPACWEPGQFICVYLYLINHMTHQPSAWLLLSPSHLLWHPSHSPNSGQMLVLRTSYYSVHYLGSPAVWLTDNPAS